MKIAILGYGSQGQAALEYWNTPDNQLTVCDQNAELQLPAGVASRLGADYLRELNEFDLLVRTPIIHPRQISEANPDAPDILAKVTTVTNEFFKVCPTKHIVGVTGTKGKGTTSTLIAKILEAAGHRVHLGGNIGIPPLELLQNEIQADDWVVLELANFQLIDLAFSPPVAVCVAVEPEHLDWHADLNEYLTAKQQMFMHQAAGDLAVYNRLSRYSEQVAAVSKGTKVSYEVPAVGTEPHETTGAYVRGDTIYMNDEAVCRIADVALPGRHNVQNVCAAVAAVWETIGGKTDVITEVVRTMKSLPHRLEPVRTLDDVTYYDDSLGTTPETAIAAIEAFDEPKVLLLGGSDKGTSFDTLAQVVAKNNIRSVVMIEGDTAPKIVSSLQAAGYDRIVSGGTTMRAVVEAAQAQAQKGDVVLLSPACASFGLFKDYKDRGEQFKAAVQALV